MGEMAIKVYAMEVGSVGNLLPGSQSPLWVTRLTA